MSISKIRSAVRASFATPCIIVLVVVQYFLIDPVHNRMMQDAIVETSFNWHAYLAKEMLKGAERGNFENFVETVRAGLATNTLQQVDLFNQVCHCAISITVFPPVEEAKHALSISRLIKGELPHHQTLAIGSHPIPVDLIRAEREAKLRKITHANSGDLLGINEGDHQHLVADLRYITLGPNLLIGVQLHMNMTSSAEAHYLMVIMLSALITALVAILLYSAERFIRRSLRAEEMSHKRALYLAQHDSLTGFCNRYGFQALAERMLKDCRDARAEAYMLIYDADKFKEINDHYGHATGDQMLVEIAQALRRSYPSDAIFGRLGGDEFAILVMRSSIKRGKELCFAAGKNDVNDALANAVADVEISTSTGYAVFPYHGETFEDLMKAADLALIAVKQTAKSTIGAYDASMKERFERRIWEIEGVRAAAGSREIIPFYQPIVSSQTGKICLFEALARWNHPQQGILTPAIFENALNDPNVSRLLTGAMLDAIVQDMKVWWDMGYPLPVSLNLGEADLKQAELPDLLSAALDRHEMPPQALWVEITESAVCSNTFSEVLHILEDIQSRDIEISLDDFGTGTSSITLLQTLPCSKLKIDKSFVDGVALDGDDTAIVRALTRLGHDLNLNIVAEGVENAGQVQILRDIGVDYFQGYHYSAPIPAGQVEEQLQRLGYDALVERPFEGLTTQKTA